MINLAEAMIIGAYLYVFKALYREMRAKHWYAFEKNKRSMRIQVYSAIIVFLCFISQMVRKTQFTIQGYNREAMGDEAFCNFMIEVAMQNPKTPKPQNPLILK